MEQLAHIFGTEKDKVNCSFYWKIGVCRHGEKCKRKHNRPPASQTLLIPHMYTNPVVTPMFDQSGNPLVLDPEFLTKQFNHFYEDVFNEMKKYGSVEYLHVCDNVCDHMLGNVYVKFKTEEMAQNALASLSGRYYAGRLLQPEFSPVTNFKEARCRQYELGNGHCDRAGNCNFLHLKKPTKKLIYKLYGDVWKEVYYDYYKYDQKKKSHSHSHSHGHSHSHSQRHSHSKRKREDENKDVPIDQQSIIKKQDFPAEVQDAPKISENPDYNDQNRFSKRRRFHSASPSSSTSSLSPRDKETNEDVPKKQEIPQKPSSSTNYYYGSSYQRQNPHNNRQRQQQFDNYGDENGNLPPKNNYNSYNGGNSNNNYEY